VVYLKRYQGESLAARVRRWLATGHWESAAGYEARIAVALAADGIATVEPLAWAERGADSFVVINEVPGDAIDRALTTTPLGGRALQYLTTAVADLARRFHDRGWRHRDFYLCHLFMESRVSAGVECTAGHEPDPLLTLHQRLRHGTGQASGATSGRSHRREEVESDPSGRFMDRADDGFRVALIDLQRVFRPRWRKERWLVKDLAQLNYSGLALGLSAATRLRFFERYVGVRRLGPAEKRLLRRVLAKSRAMICRHGLVR
jgi:hypothetical protein